MSSFYVNFSSDSNSVYISFDFKLNDSTPKQHFNFERNKSETIEMTLKKIENRIENDLKKKQKKPKVDLNQNLAQNLTLNEPNCIKLVDASGNQVGLDEPNEKAWKNDCKLMLFDKVYQVQVNLPRIKNLVLPKKMIAGLPAALECIYEFSIEIEQTNFKWFHSKNDCDIQSDSNKIEWIQFDEGVNKKICYLTNSTVNKFIKVIATPNDGKQDGLSADVVSTSRVDPKMNLESFPMTLTHQFTSNQLKNNNLRVMSYNIFVKSFSDDEENRVKLYSYCSVEYMMFSYRRILLLHEILNYNSDIIFLQECEAEFFRNELLNSFPNHTAKFWNKFNSGEGEVTLFRNDKFRFVKSHDIVLNQQLQTDPFYSSLWKLIEQNHLLCKVIKKKGTVLQLSQIEDLNRPGNHLLLANTHLYYHPQADFIRLLQLIISMKYIESVKDILLNDSNIKNVSVLFGGDFNSSFNSPAISYLMNKRIPYDKLSNHDSSVLSKFGKLFSHKIDLDTKVADQVTHCIELFEGTIDYIFYEKDSFKLNKMIKMPTTDRIKENIALPSKYFPSDHLPIIYEFIFN